VGGDSRLSEGTSMDCNSRLGRSLRCCCYSLVTHRERQGCRHLNLSRIDSREYSEGSDCLEWSPQNRLQRRSEEKGRGGG
jgi:hypothetical protein